MITIGSGAHSIQLYSQGLQVFQKDCLLLEQNGLFKISYVSEDNGIKVYHDTDNLTEAMELFWQILTRSFAAIAGESGKKIIFLSEEGDFFKIVNCSYDLKIVLGGTPCGYSFNELIREDERSSQLWHVSSLDGRPTQEKLWLKKKELLARFCNRNFWAYKFSRSKRVNSSAKMTQHQPPISSIG